MRVFRVHGVLSQQLATMPLSRILDITVVKPLHGRLLGFGHFVFESAAQEQGLREIRYVGRADERDLVHPAGRAALGPAWPENGQLMVLPFDPIDEAARQWGRRWDGVPAMHAVTSLMRVQQLVLGPSSTSCSSRTG